MLNLLRIKTSLGDLGAIEVEHEAIDIDPCEATEIDSEVKSDAKAFTEAALEAIVDHEVVGDDLKTTEVDPEAGTQKEIS